MYNWEHREAICRQLYVDENKSLDEVMAILKDDGFAPSKRAFQMQFRRWNFPLKHHPLSDDDDLHARIKELWECNTRQKDMLQILEEEGYGIKERELMRIRAKNGWLLRESNGSKEKKTSSKRKARTSENQETERSDEEATPSRFSRDLENAIGSKSPPTAPATSSSSGRVVSDILSAKRSTVAKARELKAGQNINLTTIETPEQTFQRQQRLAELQALSEEKWKTGKRRRRTKSYAGLAPDPVGPPRFPSETTIDESKVALQILDNKLYRALRDEFQLICEQDGIRKKTDVGPERWHAAKERFITQSPHLQSMIYGDTSDPEAMEHKQLCLDVICLDVTKRIRTMGTKMTLLEARNVLGLNPEQTRRARGIFYAMLKNDNFITKTMAGGKRWNELKAKWIAEADSLSALFSDGDPHGTKDKALEILAKDIVKRLRDDLSRVHGKPKASRGPSGGPGPAPPRYEKTGRRAAATSAAERTAAMALAATASDGLDTLAAATDLQIDPTLLLAAEHIHDQANNNTSNVSYDAAASSGAEISPASHLEPLPSVFSYSLLAPSQRSHDISSNTGSRAQKPNTVSPTPVFFHLLRSTSMTTLPKPDWWMDMLQIFNVAEVEQKVQDKHPGAVVLQIRGEQDESRVTVRNDGDLERYLDGVEAGRARLGIVVGFM